MPAVMDRMLQQIERDGFAILPGVFSAEQIDGMVKELTAVLSTSTEATIRGQAGTVSAARNLLTLWPAGRQVWRQSPLPEVLAAVLGPAFGLVRALYFDKPPDQTWALPSHKDMTIAVRDNKIPSKYFGKPTRKAGVPHVEADETVLATMLTARIHLDDVTEENGPLQVIPGSHRFGKALTNGETAPQPIFARKGDVLLIRPLVEHNSGRSHPDTRRHRRIVHLEFAASPKLPDGYQWHDYFSGDES